jgi:hypothetical protein
MNSTWFRGGLGGALAGLLALALGSGCRRSSQDDFTRSVADRVRALRPEATVVVQNPLLLEVTLPGEQPITMGLENLWRQCGGRIEGCESVARHVRGVLAGPGVEPRPELVRAVLKDREWVESARRMLSEGPPEKSVLMLRPFVADLFVVYVIDMPDGMRMVTQGDATKLALDEPQLHELALSNLVKAAGDIPFRPLEDGSAIRLVAVGDSYEASRVLLHDRWAPIAAKVQGSLVVAAPARDTVLFTGSEEDVPGLRALARRVADEAPHPLSPTLLRWTKERWVAFDADPSGDPGSQ